MLTSFARESTGAKLSGRYGPVWQPTKLASGFLASGALPAFCLGWALGLFRRPLSFCGFSGRTALASGRFASRWLRYSVHLGSDSAEGGADRARNASKDVFLFFEKTFYFVAGGVVHSISYDYLDASRIRA